MYPFHLFIELGLVTCACCRHCQHGGHIFTQHLDSRKQERNSVQTWGGSLAFETILFASWSWGTTNSGTISPRVFSNATSNLRASIYLNGPQIEVLPTPGPIQHVCTLCAHARVGHSRLQQHHELRVCQKWAFVIICGRSTQQTQGGCFARA